MAAEGVLLRAGIPPAASSFPLMLKIYSSFWGLVWWPDGPCQTWAGALLGEGCQLGATADLKMFSGAGKMLQVLASASRKASRRLK